MTRIRLLRTKAFTYKTERNGRALITKDLALGYFKTYFLMKDDSFLWKQIYQLGELARKYSKAEITGLDSVSNDGLRLNQAKLIERFRYEFFRGHNEKEPLKSQIHAYASTLALGLIKTQEEMISRRIFFFDKYEIGDN